MRLDKPAQQNEDDPQRPPDGSARSGHNTPMVPADESGRYGDDDPVVQLDDFGDPMTAEIIAAKLRSFGIRARAQSATVKGRPIQSGNVVWIFASDLQAARELIAEG